MHVIEFLRRHAVEDARFERFNTFDPNLMDYTLQIRTPSGQTIMLRNPQEAEGTLIDKGHAIEEGSELLAAGTAFWNWRDKNHSTVGIDVDADDHANGQTAVTFERTLAAVKKVPWLEARRSSRGRGVHLFPSFNRPVEISSRKEATALAQAVLTLASREADFDLKAVKDVCGGNMWFYKGNAPSNAYEVIKEATAVLDVDTLPAGWREATKIKSGSIKYAPSTTPLSEAHLEIEKHLRQLPYTLIFNRELGCFHCHTRALQIAYETHGYRGYFRTVSEGNDPGTANAFMFPLADGAFLVKRFGNVPEDGSWCTGANGPFTYLNTAVPFKRAVFQFAQNQTSKGHAFSRSNLELLARVTGKNIDIPEAFEGRTFFLKVGELHATVSVERHEFDPELTDWTLTNKNWQRSFPIPPPSPAILEASVIQASASVRAVATEVESTKWSIQSDDQWVSSSAQEVKNVLIAEGEQNPCHVMGRMRQEPFWLVYEPFQPEYLNGRKWNREAPQLACAPADVPTETPTWDAMFEHIGRGFHDDVVGDEDCQARGITSGAHYLQLWVKLLIERPQQRTPYLFLTSRQNNTGKTSLGASITHLINPGVGEINEEALVDKFTSELEGKVLCLIEELDLRDNRHKAYATLKRILTSRTLTIRRMRTDAYNVPNLSHFIHTANDAMFVPCQTEDLRIVMINVPKIEHFIESAQFEEGVKQESPSMLRKLLDLPLPEACGRFWLPVVQTELKESVLTGLYENEPSEAKEGVKKFAAARLQMNVSSATPQSLALKSYAQYCVNESLPAVAKMEFAKVLREVTQCKVERKQKRIEGKQVWHYTGFALSC